MQLLIQSVIELPLLIAPGKFLRPCEKIFIAEIPRLQYQGMSAVSRSDPWNSRGHLRTDPEGFNPQALNHAAGGFAPGNNEVLYPLLRQPGCKLTEQPFNSLSRFYTA